MSTHQTPEEKATETEARKQYTIRLLGNHLVIGFEVSVLDMLVGTKIKNSILNRLQEFDYIDIIVDMRNIISIDSTGLALLAFLLNKTKKQTLGKVHLYKVNEKLYTILKLASMTSFFSFLDDAGLEQLKASAVKEQEDQ